MEGMGRRHPALPYPMSGGPLLLGGQIRVLSSDFAATSGAPANPHPVPSYFRSGQGRKVGNVGEVYPLFNELPTAAWARFQGHRHVHWQFGNFFGMWSLAEREPALSRLAAGTPGLLGAGPLGEGGGLALFLSAEPVYLGAKLLNGGLQFSQLKL
jgi:hypothetical protein